MEDNITTQDLILVRRALEAYHTYLMALNSNSDDVSKQNELARIESLHRKIGLIQVP